MLFSKTCHDIGIGMSPHVANDSYMNSYMNCMDFLASEPLLEIAWNFVAKPVTLQCYNKTKSKIAKNIFIIQLYC